MLDFCRTPGYKFGRCISIYECDYLLNILSSKMLSQQSIRFLQLSQCEPVANESGKNNNKNVPHVCCARNDDSLILQLSTGGAIQTQTQAPPSSSAIFITTYDSATDDENSDDSIVLPNANDTGLLPGKNECGVELIENRIYSGQVSF